MYHLLRKSVMFQRMFFPFHKKTHFSLLPFGILYRNECGCILNDIIIALATTYIFVKDKRAILIGKIDNFKNTLGSISIKFKWMDGRVMVVILGKSFELYFRCVHLVWGMM